MKIPATLEPTAVATTRGHLPINYVEAKAALSRCLTVDQAVEWRDRAAAAEAYYRMSRDNELVRVAQRIKVRAGVRAGEILAEFDNRTASLRGGARGDRPISARGAAASAAGISRDDMHTFVRASRLAVDIREQLIEGDRVPSLRDLAQRVPPNPILLGPRSARSDIYRRLMNPDIQHSGLSAFRRFCTVTPIRSLALHSVTADEAALLRAAAADCAEWLDELEQRLPK